jgi:hypothetical protein
VSIIEPLKTSINQLKADLKSKEQEIQTALDENTGYINDHAKEYAAPKVAWDLAHTDDKGSEQPGTTTLGDDQHEES